MVLNEAVLERQVAVSWGSSHPRRMGIASSCSGISGAVKSKCKYEASPGGKACLPDLIANGFRLLLRHCADVGMTYEATAEFSQDCANVAGRSCFWNLLAFALFNHEVLGRYYERPDWNRV